MRYPSIDLILLTVQDLIQRVSYYIGDSRVSPELATYNLKDVLGDKYIIENGLSNPLYTTLEI